MNSGIFGDQPPPEDREALLRENAKLRKINRVLMDRVERSMDYQGNAFSLFQTAIVLENRVRERTQALGQAMRDLEKTNQELSQAKTEAETAQIRLADAIETVSDGFLLCDRRDRIVICNTKFKTIWRGLKSFIRPGASFTAFLKAASEEGLIEAASWREMRATHQGTPGEPMVVQLGNGTWLRVSERATRDGGTVGIYADITEIKLAEQRLREAELAKKSALLQATLDTITQGISVFNRDHMLVASNRQFTDLLGLDAGMVPLGTPLEDLIRHPAVHAQLREVLGGGDGEGEDAAWGSGEAELAGRDAATLRALLEDERLRDLLGRPAMLELRGPAGQTLEIRRNPMPDGGFVSTYTDITERTRAAEALRDSERRLRLITDAMPALIAYVDADLRYRFTNRAYEDWFGRPRSEIDGHTMQDALGGHLYRKREIYVERAMKGEFVTYEMPMPSDKSSIEYAHATYIPHIAEDGEVLGFFALIQDITERRRAARGLQEANENLERRVAERTAALMDLNEALRQAKAAADNANLSKTKFLAAASHDLLQPMNAAQVFAAALAERSLGERERHILGNLTTALEAVDDLLSSLLEISRLEAGVLNPDPRDFSIGGLLSMLSAEYEPLAAAKGLTLRTVGCARVVRTDYKLVNRVLRNFLSNALRYTDAGGILMGCRRRPEGLLVGVWDTGIGIPQDKLKEIFEEFRRLKRERTSTTDNGVGLGLAIVERIAVGLGHEVVVRSQPGRGSFFGLVIPYGEPVTPAAVAPRPAASAPGGAVGGHRVLIVDNETSIVAGMRELLEGWGCQVETATTVVEATAHMAAMTPRPSVLIADYHLADGETGLDVVAAAAARYGERVLPGLVITADRTPEVAHAVAAAGCDLMTKPLRPARLRAMLAHLLSRAGAGEEEGASVSTYTASG